VILPGSSSLLLLRTFGGLSLERSGEVLGGAAAQRGRLAILACLAVAGEHGLSRDRLLALFWPESDTSRARAALRQALYSLRQATGADLTTGTSQLRLNRREIESDVTRFLTAAQDGRDEEAIALYTGPWLDGVHVDGCPDLDRWLDSERSRLAGAYRACLERLAIQAHDQGRQVESVGWWRRLAADDPLSSGIAVRLIDTLADAGDLAGALHAARVHEQLLADEYELGPSAEVMEAVRRVHAAQRSRTSAPLAEDGPHEHAADADRSFDLPVNGSADSWSTTHVDGGRQDTGSQSAGVAAPASRANRARRILARSPKILVAGVLVALGLAGAKAISSPTQPDFSDYRIAVAPFENLTGEAAYDPVGYAAADWIAQGIAESGLLDVVSPLDAMVSTRWLSREHETSPGPQLARAFAAENGARILVSGAYTRQGDEIVLHARIVDAESGELLRAAGEASARPESLQEATELLRQTVLGALGTVVDERLTSSARGTRMPPSYQAYAEFAEGMDLFVQASYEEFMRPSNGRPMYTEAAARFERAASLDSTYTMPVLWTAFAWYASDRERAQKAGESIERLRSRMPPAERAMADYIIFILANDRLADRELSAERLERYYQLAKRAAQYAPDSEWLWKYARAARNTGRLHEALAALDQVNPNSRWIERWPIYWRELSEVLHMLGDCERELEVRERFSRVMPHDGWNGPAFRMRALACLGREHDIRQMIDSLPDLLPGHFWAELHAHGFGSLADSVARVRAIAHLANLNDTNYSRSVSPGTLWQAGRFAEAHEAYSVLADTAPPDWRPSLLRTIGTLKVMLGDTAGARAILEELKTYDGDRTADPNGNARFSEVQIAAALGDHEYAVKVTLEKIAAGRPSLFYGSPAHGGLSYSYDFHYNITRPGIRQVAEDPRVRPLLVPRDGPPH
jgi:DNA-binding SARP family transcriptional activator/TolB-like protein